MSISPLRAILPCPSALPLNEMRKAGIRFGFEVGTGGAATPEYLRKRGAKGYRFPKVSQLGGEAITTVDIAPKECLERVRDILKPTIKELADAVGVSRQAIYDWLSGKRVSQANAERLAELAYAADIVAAEGIGGSPWLVRRPVKEGKGFFSLVKEGVSATSAAHSLVKIVRTESRQRRMLKERLAGRRMSGRGAFEQIGIPMLDERG